MLDKVSLSDALGYASITCWLGAQFPQVVENIRRQSCEGLALPFLANWLMGDISNLVGCVLTHQLPFQTYLATYFVCVDFMLVAQYMYYYKPPKGPPSILGHLRSATSPIAARRMSVDRGASRYRTLSALASNMAAAAAIAAQQDEQQSSDLRRSSARHSRSVGGRQRNDGSTVMVDESEITHDEIPSAMADSFYSEGGRDVGRKRVSWSIERHEGRAASVGRSLRSPTPVHTHLHLDESIAFPRDQGPALSSPHDPLIDSVDSSSPVISTRGSRVSRRGSTMVFLGAWALFGIGTLAGKQAVPSGKTTNIGRVLSPNHIQSPDSIPAVRRYPDIHTKPTADELDSIELNFSPLDIDTEDNAPSHEPSTNPSSEQVLGRFFAWLCTTLYLTSRLPQIWKNYVRKSVEGLSMYLFVFAFLGNVFYVSSILVSPKRFLPPPASTYFIRESIPYLLGSGGTLVFDITIVAQSFLYRPRPRRQSAMYSRLFDEEDTGLLSGDVLSAHPPSDSAISSRGRTLRESTG